MLVYIAIPNIIEGDEELMVSTTIDGIKKKCIECCLDYYDELQDVQTEVEIEDDKLVVEISGKDPEDLYIQSQDNFFRYKINFKLIQKETD